MDGQLSSYLSHFVKGSSSCNEVTDPDRSSAECYSSDGLNARKFYEKLIAEDKSTQTHENCRKSILHANKTIESGNKGDSSESHDESEVIKMLRLKRETNRKYQTENELFRAITEKDISTVRSILSVKTGLLDIEDDHGWSPLMCAVASGNLEVVRYLVQCGANIFDKRDLAGKSAWDIAFRINNIEILNFLCENKIKKETPTPEEEIYPDEAEELEYHFCDICKIQIDSKQRKTHETSTSHLFNVFKEKETPTYYHLDNRNIGYKMLKGAGWMEEHGLGPEGKGQKHPVATYLKNDRSGLGLTRKKRKKITHFKANDVHSVRKHKKSHNDVVKKGSLTLQRNNRQWERNLRRYLNSD